jgi:nicotinamide-nucleotide amidase
LTGEQPEVDQQILADIANLFTRRGVEMPLRNAKQAWKIPSAAVIKNDQGTAPGWLVEADQTIIIALPGPPRENQPMWLERVRPVLLPRLMGQTIVSRTIRTIGIGESAVADILSDLIRAEWPQVATYAKADGVHVTITAAHDDRVVATNAVQRAEQEAIRLLAPHVYGSGDDSLAAAITQPLAAAGVRILIVEIGSAGTLSSLLLSDPSARRAIAEARLYPPDARETASSPSLDAGGLAVRTARRAARESELGTVAVLAVCIADEDQRVSDGSVGVVLAHAGGFASTTSNVHGRPEEIRRRAALLAAEFLWRELNAAARIRPVLD